MNGQIPGKSRWLGVLMLGSALALAGCGGGGGSSSVAAVAPSGTSISGTAAVGAGISNGTVTAVCADGSGFTQSVTTDANGSWSGTVSNGVLPCALQVTGGTPPVTLHGYASSAGTVNITPLTDLALALATSQDPAVWFAAFDGTAVDVATAADDLLDELANSGFTVPGTGNPFTTPFAVDGTGWDGLLDDLGTAIENDVALADYAALVALIKDGNLGNLPAPPPPEMFVISGTITGASGSVTWETRDDGFIHHDGGDANGAVTFTQTGGMEEGSVWSVQVQTPPSGQSCSVTNGSGTLTADVTNVLIECSDLPPDTFSISGTISGATGSVGWSTTADAAAHNSGSSGNGAVNFTLPAGMASGAAYSVTVTSEPSGQSCLVSNGSGTLSGDVTTVAITCTTDPVATNYYSISGSITGATGSVTWETRDDGFIHHDGGDTNGAVTFTQLSGMEEGSAWSVQVQTPPSGQVCSVTNGSGTLTTNVTNVLISCQDDVPPEPSERLYDFSALDLTPVEPAGLVPAAPSQSPVDPGPQIASLFAQFGQQQLNAIFAPTPPGILSAVTDVYDSYYQVSEYLPDLSWARQLQFGFGNDGVANTSDDVLRGYSVAPYGQASVQYSFNHPGPDNTWFTDDDIPGNMGLGDAVYFPNGALLEFEGASEGAILIIPCLDAGDDGVLFSQDDQPGCTAGYQVAVLDGEGHRGQVVYYDSQGPDGVWFTADDRVKTYNLATFNAAGVSLSSVTYNARGGDNTWFTSDDQVQLHTLTILDAGFKPAYTATYNNRGTDSAWFTADDVIQSWTYYGYDGNGNSVLVATHTNKGGDGTWFTADDSATGMVSLKDADGNVLVNSQVSGSGAMGPDGKWLTGDENFSFFFYAEYDENGYQTRNAQFNGAGADGLWFTADDTPYQYNYWDRTYDSEGNLQQQITYNPTHAPADPAFSESHIDQYRVYQPGTSSYVTVNRADFGGDGLPFTSDDTIPWPYTVQVVDGYDQYNQPGPDGIWYTADDVRSGYVRWQYSGNRKTREDRYNAADELIGYSEATPITASEYRWDNYTSDGVGGFTLTDYAIIEEDGNGYALWTTWYTAADAVSYVEYTERDAGGNILRQGWGYSPGADLAWGTFDDFGYFSVSEYDGSDLVSSGTERPGDDGLWGTEDDSYSLDAIYQMLSDPATLALNSGETAPGCADLLTGIGASGDINVQVVDQNGAPLSGVIAQLNQAGSTVTTDGNGEASFAGLSGTQDVHFFKDGYTWESFYCVAPGVDVTLQAKLSSMSEAQAKSMVAFYVSPTSERITLRLLDGNGKMINTRPQYSVFGELGSTTYAYLDFDLPAGTEVSGNLWAFKVHGSDGRLLDAQDLGPQTYTTIATYPLPGPAGEPLTVSFNASEPARLQVASRSVLSYPPGLMDTPQIKVELDELFPLPIKYESSLGGNYATAPDTTLPTLAQPSALSAGTEEWQAWYPGDYPDIGTGIFKPEIHTGFQYGPYIGAQDGSGSNPTISWTGARQLGSGDFQTVTTLELRSAAAGMGYMSHWTLHVPAGDEQVTLPSLPAGITDPYLPENRYPMIITTRAVPELGYHALVGEENLHELRRDLATETLRYGTDFTQGADLQR